MLNTNKTKMEEQKIIEGNKLIAEFMGAECLSPKTKFSYFDFGNDWSENEGIFQQKIHIRMLKYHSSWDWLMPVVEKVRDKNCIVSIWFNRQLNTNNTTIANFEDGWKKDINISGVGIESTYKSVIEFIKWHNNQKK